MEEKSDRPLTPEGIRDEIAMIQELLKRHHGGDITALGPYTYVAALKRIQYLRNRHRMFGAKVLRNIKSKE